MSTALDFVLPPELEAHEPPEARGVARDGVRLLVSDDRTGEVSHHQFSELPGLLRPGDVLVVNTSATLPAAVRLLDRPLSVHFSTERAPGEWLIELRRHTSKATAPYVGGAATDTHAMPGGGSIRLRERYSRDRLWIADVQTPTPVTRYLHEYGAPIRYDYVRTPWPLHHYQTIFARHPGSAEMPSAGRPFSDRIVTQLVAAGVIVVPILLHTGVASPEHHERPYPEWFDVPEATLATVRQARRDGRRVIAVGTTVVRALESVADSDRRAGWTDLIVTPQRGVRVVDGLLTGLHEPRASHLDMLAAVVPEPLLERTYAEAIEHRYLWHEFGDINLLLPQQTHR